MLNIQQISFIFQNIPAYFGKVSNAIKWNPNVAAILQIFFSIVVFAGILTFRGDNPIARTQNLYPVCDSPFIYSKSHPSSDVGYEVKNPYIGVWISAKELAALPTSGTAWESLKKSADLDPGVPNLKDQDLNNDIYILAKALVYARTGNPTYRVEVIDNLSKVIGTEKGGRTLALARNLPPYIIAADLINLPADPKIDRVFRSWLRSVLEENLDGKTLAGTQEDRPNNWGTHAGASRALIALYLGDRAELERTAIIFKGYLGDYAAYHGFHYGTDLSRQCDPDHPVGINPKGCMKEGRSIDGALPEEMRRGDAFTWPPAETGYAWEGLQGVMVLAEVLNRAGYATWEWQDQAILRAVNFLYSINWQPERDDEWQVWLINHAYKTNFQVSLPAHPGKNMGWTDWTHANPDQSDQRSVGWDLRCR